MGPGRPAVVLVDREEDRSETDPRVNFGGWWGADGFCAGGDVIGTGSDQARHVRLSFVDGTTVEDSVDDGVVLFLVEHGVRLPATASILDANGTVIATQGWPGVG